MEKKLRSWIEKALLSTREKGQLEFEELPLVLLELPKEKGHGDLSTNVAMVLARKSRIQPRLVAQAVVDNLSPDPGMLSKVEIAGPGFLNFFFSDLFFQESLRGMAVEEKKPASPSAGEKVLLEFVSANPTGPLNVVNARAAAVGDTLARLLRACGLRADREFYVNDEGSQIDNLGKSVEARYKELLGEPPVEFHEDWYAGEYVREIAGQVKDGFAAFDGFRSLGREIYGAELFTDERLKQLREGFGRSLFQVLLENDSRVRFLSRIAVIWNISRQQAVLNRFGVVFQNWYFQSQIGNRLQHAISLLKENGHIYEQDGAVWFRSTTFGDDKDRVLVRQDGTPTYFAPDIAYHAYKKERGYGILIDLLGPDHHGYMSRMKAAIQALGYPAESVEIYLIQLVTLISGGKPVRMSKRAGEFITMDELLDEVGIDAARWYFLSRHRDSPLEFDLDLAKLQSEENPLYYAQYAHARICSILRMAEEQSGGGLIEIVTKDGLDLSPLTHETEKELIRKMGQWHAVVEFAAANREPNHLPRYAVELARTFHSFYSECRVLGNNSTDITAARLFLSLACKKRLAESLEMMGISAPEKL